MSELELEAPNDPRLYANYVRFSPWPVLALIGGLIACLALLNDALYYLGFFGTALGIVALADVVPKHRRKAGAILALAGLFLSLFSAAAGFTHYKLNQRFRMQTARNVAEQYLELLRQDQVYRCYELTIEYPNRQPVGTDLKRYYEGQATLASAKDNHEFGFRGFENTEPETSIRQLGEEFTYQFIAVDEIQRQPKRESYLLSFWGDYPTDPKRRKFGVHLRRSDYNPPVGPQWDVIGLYGIEPYIPKKIIGVEMSR